MIRTGQNLASIRAIHSVLAAHEGAQASQLTQTQRLSAAATTACGLPCEGFDHV